MKEFEFKNSILTILIMSCSQSGRRKVGPLILLYSMIFLNMSSKALRLWKNSITISTLVILVVEIMVYYDKVLLLSLYYMRILIQIT